MKFRNDESYVSVNRLVPLISFLIENPYLVVSDVQGNKLVYFGFDEFENKFYYRVPENKKMNKWYEAHGINCEYKKLLEKGVIRPSLFADYDNEVEWCGAKEYEWADLYEAGLREDE